MKSTLLLRNAIKNVQQMIKHDLNILEVDRYRITVKAGTGGAGIPRQVHFLKYMSNFELKLVFGFSQFHLECCILHVPVSIVYGFIGYISDTMGLAATAGACSCSRVTVWPSLI